MRRINLPLGLAALLVTALASPDGSAVPARGKRGRKKARAPVVKKAPQGGLAPGKTTCTKRERLLGPGSVLLSGPSVAFAAVELVQTPRCAREISRTEDGGFVLVQRAKNAVGWLAVRDAQPGLAGTERADVAPVPTEPRVVVQQTALRTAPRMEAAGSALLPKGTALTVLNADASGVWWQVMTDQGAQGWVPRTLLGVRLVEAGDSPVAGDAPWKAAVASVVEGENPHASAAAPKKQARPSAPVARGHVPQLAVPASTLRGRGMRVALLVGGSGARQLLRSDAVADPMANAQYEHAGGALGVQADYRGQTSPIVASLHVDSALSGYTFVDPAAPGTAAAVTVTHTTAVLDVGLRAYQTVESDVELSVGMAMDVVTSSANGGVDPAQPTALFQPAGTTAQVRPALRLLSRPRGAPWLTLIYEAAMPVGLHMPAPDPFALLKATNDAGNTLRAPVPGLSAQGAGAPPDEPAPLAPSTPWGIGADGRVTAQATFTPGWAFVLDGLASVRRVHLPGEGYRGDSRFDVAWSSAMQNDVVLRVQAGVATTF